MSDAAIRYRPVGMDEQEMIARVFAASLNDLLVSAGAVPYVDLDDHAAWQQAWNNERKPLFEHVQAHDSCGWLAEQDGEAIGYARSILRDGHCQLTEFFVLPDRRLAGVGRELLRRAFEDIDARERTIIATTHPAALARYLKSGVRPLCLVADFEKHPEPVAFETDLSIAELVDDQDSLEQLDRIDEALLGYRRRADHRWLISQRQGFMYLRDGKPAGYGYVGHWSGPFALIDENDFPAVLGHAETVAAGSLDMLAIMVPMANHVATRYLLERGFRFDDGFMMVFMGDSERSGLSRYLCTMPGFFT